MSGHVPVLQRLSGSAGGVRMKRYKMHECEGGPLDVVLERDHGIVVNGLQSLVAALRYDIAALKFERDALKAGKPVLPLEGMRHGEAQVLEVNGSQYRVRCGCGQVFDRGRTKLMRTEIWRCRACWLESRR